MRRPRSSTRCCCSAAAPPCRSPSPWRGRGASPRIAAGRGAARFGGWWAGPPVLPLLFLPVKALEYADLARLHVYPSSGTQWATYYLLTGVHALHVLAGGIVSAALLAPSGATWIGDAPRAINRVEAAALYWYFVDVIWLLLFVLLYVS